MGNGARSQVTRRPVSNEIVMAIGVQAARALVGYLNGQLDPDDRKALDDATIAHVLEEIPRITRLLNARIDEVASSGCSVEEACIIAHQVFDAQRSTVDREKRRRLSNVLVNGFRGAEWSIARHRLMLRLTAELEEEHIDYLRQEARTFEERWRDSRHGAPAGSRGPSAFGSEGMSLATDRDAVRTGLERELVARGLLVEVTTPRIKRQKLEVIRGGDRPAVEDVELQRTRTLSRLGRMLLEHLRDPEADPSAG